MNCLLIYSHDEDYGTAGCSTAANGAKQHNALFWAVPPAVFLHGLFHGHCILFEVFRKWIQILRSFKKFFGLCEIFGHLVDWPGSDSFYIIGCCLSSIQVVSLNAGIVVFNHFIVSSFKDLVIDVRPDVVLSANELQIALVKLDHFVMQVAKDMLRFVFIVLQFCHNSKKDSCLQL